MSAQIAHDQSFLAACRRCGRLLYQSVDSCPYCCTERPFDTDAHAHPKTALRISAAAPTPAVAKVSLAGGSPSTRPSVLPDYLHHYQLADRRPFWHTGKGLFVKGVLLIWLIVAIAYAAFLLYGERRGQQREVRASRASLAEKSLPNANTALARDANNQGAREMQRDSAPEEQRRDNAVQSADRCASQRAWGCVREKASEALAIDPGSLHARSLMERAIVATGWSPLRSPNGAAQADPARPLPRGASPVPLPSSQDWAARRPAVPNDPNAVASSPPLPDAENISASGNIPDFGNQGASVTTTAASNSSTADAAGVDSNDNRVDAQQRAIRQSGRKHAPSSESTH